MAIEYTPEEFNRLYKSIVEDGIFTKTNMLKPHPETSCPICGKPQLHGNTCAECLTKYAEESDKWIRDNA